VRIELRELRQIISETLADGVPEWQLRQDTSTFVDRIRDRIVRTVLMNRSENGIERKHALDAMNDVCDELERKVYDLLDDALFAYSRKV